MTDNARLDAVLQAITEAARDNPRFLTDLERALATPGGPRSSPEPRGLASRPRRRSPASVDPFDILRKVGPAGLRERLSALSLDELRDIVADYRIEPYTLAMKWKTPSRVVDLIAEAIDQRSRKGDAFR